MAKSDKDKNTAMSDKDIKSAKSLQGVFRGMVDAISMNVFQTSRTNSNQLTKIDKDISDIIGDELNNVENVTGPEMSTFLVKLFNQQDNQGNPYTMGKNEYKTLADIFGDENNGLFQYFEDRYRNKNMLYDDLATVATQLFELDEAIMATRDAIVTSDDLSVDISRTLQFKGSENDPTVTSYNEAITKLEDKLGLAKKIKNIIIPQTLTYGSYYVYVCPYSSLFEEHYRAKLKNPDKFGANNSANTNTDVRESLVTHTLSESVDESFVKSFDKFIVNENASSDGPYQRLGTSSSKPNNDGIKDAINYYCKDIEIYNDCHSIPFLEGVDVTGILTDDEFRKVATNAAKGDTNAYADGTVNVDKKVDGLFDNETGCYIKYIDPRKIIPIKILDEVIGYYYIHDLEFQTTKAPFSTSIQITNTVSPNRSAEIESVFLNGVVDRIIKSFDKKFIEENKAFKDLIVNALQYNDLYRRQVKFQFIPREYIVEFKINEDENGDGQSMLSKSLFYAKLYLSLLVFKMVSIITRSNDTRVYYVKNSGIDADVDNAVQDTARRMKERQINFMDLLNYNSIISKIGAYKDVYMPVGRSGERGIEFDVIAGQDVQLNTDLMEMLHTNMLNSSGVPSVIMNYVNEAD